jgi:ribonucleotide reductase alpha subunit
MSNNLKSFLLPNIQLADGLLVAACEQLGFDSKQVFSDIKKDLVQKTIIRHVFSLTDKPESHTKLAGAITMWKQYRNSPTTILGYLKLFRQYLRDDVVKFMETHQEVLQTELNQNFHLDFNMTYFSTGCVIDTYLAKRKFDEDPSELPQLCYLRIATGQFCSASSNESEALERVIRFYRRYAQKQGTPASPTIFNMGFKEGSPSSCMIYTIDDSLDDILKLMHEAGMASKNNAGLGMDFSGLRHSNIGRHGVSQGIIPLLKIWDDITRYINQGGRRPGALTCSTRIQHYDIPEFIHLVDKVGEDQTKATKINTSIMLSDLFMKRCVDGGKWTLFCPKQTGNLNLLHGKEFEEKYLEYEKKAATWNRYKKFKILKELQETTELDIEKEKLLHELEQEFEKPVLSHVSGEYLQYFLIKERRLDEEDRFREMEKKYDLPPEIPKSGPEKKLHDKYQIMKRSRELFLTYEEDDFLYEPTKKFVELSQDAYNQLHAKFELPHPRDEFYESYYQLKIRREAEELFFVTMREKFEGIPQQIDSREFDADSIMDEICDMEIKAGMPYIIHGCNANRKNNMCNVGPVRSSNLCQEIMIPAVPQEQTGCCNLSSEALNAFVKFPSGNLTKGKFDFLEFGACTQDFVISLNRVIDETYNVSDKVMKSNELNRPIGIGVNGFADMCHLTDTPAVDMDKLPKKTGVDDDGEPIYTYVDINEEAPDYDEDALKERVLNPKLDELNWKIWSCMYYNALWRSKEEAKKYGAYPNFWTSPTAKGKLQYHLWQDEEKETGRKYPFKLYPAEPSEWGHVSSLHPECKEETWEELIEEIMKYGLRNALLLTCMPTASSANVIGNCEGTEFHMQNIYTRKIQSGDYPIINFHMVKDFEAIGLWNNKTYNNIIDNDGSILHIPEDDLTKEQVVRLRFLKEKYLTMWEIPQKIIIQLAAQRQVFIDHSQSMNLYIAHPTEELLKAIHVYTWQMGLKTGLYYLRSRAANQALRTSKQTEPKISNDLTNMIDFAIKTRGDNKEFMEKINNITMTATRLQEVMVCKFDSEGQCIGCQ